MEPRRPKKPPTASPVRPKKPPTASPESPKKPPTASPARSTAFSARTPPGSSAAARRQAASNRRRKPSRIAKAPPLTDRFRAGNSVFRCGTVALVGRPNVGKSTLLNALLGTKIAIVSEKPQTTRSRILGIQTIADAQILWLDVPGLHGHRRARNLMNARMLRVAEEAIADADLVVWVIDAASGVGPGDEAVARRIAARGGPWLAAVTQIDRRPRGALLRLLAEIGERYPEVDFVPTSGLTGENLREFVRTVATRLPEGPALHPADELTDQTARRLVEEFVREKIFEETGKEVPYRTAVQVESFVEREDAPVDVIHATIWVDRESQKRILVGRGGSMIRTIGTNARRELERTLGRRIHLELFVKVREDWSENASLLDELGL